MTYVGEFQGAGLTDNLDGMSTKEVGGVEDWRLFFADHAEYTYVGKLAGHFYDLDGKPTQALTKVCASFDRSRTSSWRLLNYLFSIRR